jgi:hypothetical protein
MITKRLVLAPVATLAVAFLAAGLALAAGSAKPAPKKFTAALNVGQETGVVKSAQRGASGHFTATLSGTTLTYTLTFTQLSGPAARHISANVLVGLCVPCTSPRSSTATLTQDQINDLTAGKTYVNVHTTKNPNGEIRGQITAVS